MHLFKALTAACAASLLAGCATTAPPSEPEIGSSPWAVQSGPAAHWHHMQFPGKAPTRFRYARKDGRDVMAVEAVSSASMLRNQVRVEPHELGNVRFSWRVPHLINGADMALRDADDSPVRILLTFEGDRSRFSAHNAMLSELVQAVTGEPLPYATLMYVWCNKREPGSVIRNARTDRLRKLVVEAGSRRLDQWLDYERDIRADFEKAFGEAPGALVGIAIMSDSDNTRTTTQAWYGPVQLARAQSMPRRP